MLSICTSIYRETDSLEVFVRTVFGNASDPSQIEIIVANDEASPATSELLSNLSLEYPNLKHFSRSKFERVQFLRKMVDLYRGEKVFNEDELLDMEDRISKYESGELDTIWFPPGKLFNKAAGMASGDVLLFVPADYICFADLSKLYEAFKEIPGDIVGHFDWLDTTSLDPMPDILNIVRGLKTRVEFYEATNSWLQQAFSNNVTHVWQQHGMRMVKKEIFEKAGKFDGRWFVRSWNDDYMNRKMSEHAETYRLLDLDRTKLYSPYFGALRGKNWKEPTYLCSMYKGLPEIHNQFLSRIQFQIERGV